MLYDRKVALSFLGHVSNDLNIIRDRAKRVNLGDFDDLVHKAIFGALNNLALQKDINEVDGMVVDNFLKSFPVQYETFKKYNGAEIIDSAKKYAQDKSLEYSYNTLKKFSILRRFQMVGMDVREIYDESTFDMAKLEQQRIALDSMRVDDIKHHFKLKLLNIDSEFSMGGDSFSFRAGDVLEDLIERCKGAKHWGVSFQSKLYNSIFRGMQGSKYMIRSGGTGSGKTRLSISDMCNIACKERYVPEIGQWIVNNKTEDVTFISTELTEDEVNLAILANVSGVPEDTIKDGKYSEEVEYRIKKACSVIKDAKIHCEYNSDYSIDEIENMIEKNIIRNGTKYVFFDYIQITASLAQELTNLFGYTLREDQMLNQLSTALKNMSNKYDVFILTSTQLNRSYKTDQYLDATHLRGGMSTADKADFVIIAMKTTKADIEKLNPILEEGFKDIPTHAHHIVKNRGGKWVGIIVWLKIDLDTINIKDCFVTTQDYELVYDIAPVTLK